MRKFYKYIKNNLASIIALTFSALTLYIYVRQTNILAEQTRASLWPYVQISCGMGIEETFLKTFYISVSNSGTGPAIIEHVVVKINGIEVENWDDFFKKVSPPFEILFGISINSLRDRVIMPGQNFKFIEFSNNFELLNYLHPEHFNNMEIAICYKSVYNEHWTVSFKGLGGDEPVIERHNKSKKCTLNATTYFMN